MGFAIISFLIAFLLIASGGLLMFYRDRIQDRISSALYPRANKRSITSTLEETRQVIGGVVEHFEKILPRSQAEISVVQQRLVRAGMRNDGIVKIFYGAKVLVPIMLVLLALATGAGPLQSLLCVHAVPWHWFSGTGFLAGKKDCCSASGNTQGLA